MATIPGGKALLTLAPSPGWVSWAWEGRGSLNSWFPDHDDGGRDEVGLQDQGPLWAASLARSCPPRIVGMAWMLRLSLVSVLLASWLSWTGG